MVKKATGASAGSPEGPYRTLGCWLADVLETRCYYLVYTGLFLLVAAVSYALLFIDGRSFVWSTDGATQHLPALVYLRDWVSEFAQSITHGDFSLSTWDLSIGMGNDMVTALSFYGVGDVLNLLSLLVPREQIGLAYTGIAVLRLYLSGVAFSLFARRFNLRGYAVLTAAVIYAFSGFSLFMVLRHPHFIDPLIYLPLICLGAEKVIEGENPLLFVVSLWLMFCAHFYLSYMVCVFAVGFAVCRLAMRRRSRNEVAVAMLKLAGLGVVAACLAAPLLLPNALAVLDSSRTETGGYVPLLYSASYYLELIPTFSTIGFAGNQCYIGVTPLGVLAFAFLFLQAGRSAHVVKAACFLLLLSILVPWAGHAMNGFFYVANRHSFGLVFVACGLVAWLLPRMLHADEGKLRRLAIVGGVYCIGVAVAAVYAVTAGEAEGNFGDYGPALYAARAVLLAVVMAVTVAVFRLSAAGRLGVAASVVACSLAVAVVLVDGVAMSAVYRSLMLGFDDVRAVVQADPFERADGDGLQAEGGFGSESTASGERTAHGTESGAGVGLPDGDATGVAGNGELYRFDSGSLEWDDGFAAKPVTRANSGMIDGRFYDTQYFSLTPWSVSDFLSGELELGGYALSGHHYWEPDGRASLLDLLSVRYWTGDDGRRPFGFEAAGGGYAENAGAVPFGFTYERVIGREDYEQLDAVEKQEALMSAAVVDDVGDAVSAGLVQGGPVSAARELAARVTASGQADVPHNGSCGIRVAAGGEAASVTLEFDPVSDVELYVELVDFSPSQGAQGNVTVRARSGGDSAWCRFVPPGAQAYSAYDSGLLFLGYSAEERSQVTLSLPARYDYGFGAVRVWALPLDGHRELADALSRDHLEHVELAANRISGDIEVGGSKLLCLSIPFSSGWRARIDGLDAEIVRVNTSMCGILLDGGRHVVELRYDTPGLRVGIVLFAVGVLSLVAIEVVRWRARAHRRRPASRRP